MSSAVQANEWAVRANEQMDERVAQYLCLNSWLFSTIVHGSFAHFLIFLLLRSLALITNESLARLFAHLPAHLLICPLIRPFVCSFYRSFTHLPARSSICWSIFHVPRNSMRGSRPSFHLSICPSVRLYVNVSDRPFFHPYVRSSISISSKPPRTWRTKVENIVFVYTIQTPGAPGKIL